MKNRKDKTKTKMKNYKIIGGYYVPRETKEEILNVLVNVMSSRGIVVDLKFLKSLSKEQLKNKLENINKNYNCIVYEYDINGNYTVNKGIKTDNGVEYAGKSVYFHTKEEFLNIMYEIQTEGNKINSREEFLINEIKRELEEEA